MSGRCIQLVHGGRDLSRTPGLIEAQRADEVGQPAPLDAVDEVEARRGAGGVEPGEHRDRRVGEAEVRDRRVDRDVGGVDRRREEAGPAEDRIFGRDRGRQAVAERGGVGEQVRREHVRAGRGAGELEVVGVEVEERGGATGGEAGELDERLVDVHVLLGAAELIDAERRKGLADALLRAGGAAAVGTTRAVAGVEAHEGAQGAVAGLGAGIEVDAHPGAVTRGVATLVELAGIGGLVAALEPRAAGEAQAGVGAGNVEEAGAVGGADADVLDRNRLLDRQVGGVRGADRREGSGGPEQRAFQESHRQPQFFETHSAASSGCSDWRAIVLGFCPHLAGELTCQRPCRVV